MSLAAAAVLAGAILLQQQQHQHPPAPPPTAVPQPAQEHVHAQEPAPAAWHLMQDGVAFFTFNHQGGQRGDDEVVSQNWWMGMAARRAGAGELSFSLMLSLDPLTQYGDGYAELFQTGETWGGRPIIDRQHPHEFLMQAGVMWRVPIGGGYKLTLSGAPVGEPTLGPVAFMHRRSAAENLAAPLGHHTLDSTHIAHGVIAAGIDRGAWSIESSIFRGKEPDEQRWDLMDPGALDSWAMRVWYRPTKAWELQVSHGFLNEPEAIGLADVRRTTASASWLRERETNWTAATVAFGHNEKSDGHSNSTLLAEATHRFGLLTAFGRWESAQVETDVLLTGAHAHSHGAGDADLHPAWVTTLTAGITRELRAWRGFELAGGADLTAHRVPDVLKSAYGSSPLSLHVFLRLRTPANMGRMWNHVMTQPMKEHALMHAVR